MNVEETAVINAANLPLFMVNLAPLLIFHFRQTDLVFDYCTWKPPTAVANMPPN